MSGTYTVLLGYAQVRYTCDNLHGDRLYYAVLDGFVQQTLAVGVGQNGPKIRQ